MNKDDYNNRHLMMDSNKIDYIITATARGTNYYWGNNSFAAIASLSYSDAVMATTSNTATETAISLWAQQAYSPPKTT